MFRHSLNKWVFKHSLYGWAMTNSSDHLVLIVEQRQETSVIPLCRKTFNAYSLCMAINTIVITSVGLNFIQTCVSRHWAVVILETSQGWQKKKHQGLYESLCFCHITQPTFFSSTEFGSNTEGKKQNIKKQTEGISFKKCDVFPTIRTVKSTLQRKNVPMVITQYSASSSQIIFSPCLLFQLIHLWSPCPHLFFSTSFLPTFCTTPTHSTVFKGEFIQIELEYVGGIIFHACSYVFNRYTVRP